MSSYVTTVIKTGNSYALRIPKGLVEEARLELGDKATIGSVQKHKKQDHAKISQLLRALQETNPYHEIKDPVAWQREIRASWDRPLPGRD